MTPQKHTSLFSLLMIVVTIFMLNACSKVHHKVTRKQENYVVLLDLSDRLLAQQQDMQDITAIMTVFDKFEHDVYGKLIVNSKDKFCVRIIPQDNSPLNRDSLDNLLMLDMGIIPLKDKKNKLLAFVKQLKPTLEYVYQTAGKGILTSDYQGVDIWRYFNESLSADLTNNYNNHLIILTDGYFDFESYKNTKRRKNRFTSTIFFKDLERNDWKSFAQKKNYGLLPVDKKFPETEVTLIGIHPKSKQLDQLNKLIYFWDKWLKEMHFRVLDIIKKNNAVKIKGILKKNKI